MGAPTPGFKIASGIWAIVIGGGIIALAGSILLPSTKRARVDFDKMRHMMDESPDPVPSTAPAASGPATTAPHN